MSSRNAEKCVHAILILTLLVEKLHLHAVALAKSILDSVKRRIRCANLKSCFSGFCPYKRLLNIERAELLLLPVKTKEGGASERLATIADRYCTDSVGTMNVDQLISTFSAPFTLIF